MPAYARNALAIGSKHIRMAAAFFQNQSRFSQFFQDVFALHVPYFVKKYYIKNYVKPIFLINFLLISSPIIFKEISDPVVNKTRPIEIIKADKQEIIPIFIHLGMSYISPFTWCILITFNF